MPSMTLFFDAVGTLIDLAEPVEAVYARHFSECGFSCQSSELAEPFRTAMSTLPPPAYTSGHSGDFAEQQWWHALVIEVFLQSFPQSSDFINTADFTALFQKLFSYYAQPGAWTVFPDVPTCLERVTGHARLGVLSNFDDRLTPILEGLGLNDYFEHIITSSSARARKPSSTIFTHALAAFNTSATQVIHVGDSRHADFEGAQASGISAFLIERPHSSLHDFLDFCGLPPK